MLFTELKSEEEEEKDQFQRESFTENQPDKESMNWNSLEIWDLLPKKELEEKYQPWES